MVTNSKEENYVDFKILLLPMDGLQLVFCLFILSLSAFYETWVGVDLLFPFLQ